MNNKILYQGSASSCCIYVVHYMDREGYNQEKLYGTMMAIATKTLGATDAQRYIADLSLTLLETIETDEGYYHRAVAVFTTRGNARRDYLIPHGNCTLPDRIMGRDGVYYNLPISIVIKPLLPHCGYENWYHLPAGTEDHPRIMQEIMNMKRPSQIQALGVYTTRWDSYEEEYCDVIVKLHDNMVEMLNDKMKCWTHGYLTTLNDYGLHSTRWHTSTKYKAFYINNTLVVSDNNKALQNTLPQIEEIVRLNPTLRAVSVNQYSIFDPAHGNVSTSLLKASGRVMIEDTVLELAFLSQDRIREIKQTSLNGAFYGSRPGEGALRLQMKYSLPYQGRILDYGLETMFAPKLCSQAGNRIMVPFNPEENVSAKALDLYIQYAKQEINIADFIEKYKEVASVSNPVEGDVLDIWFKSCAANSNREQEQLLQSYKTLKKRLVVEHYRAGVYLKHNNLAQKMPIPAIRIKGSALAKNIQGKIAVDILNREYYDFGRERLRSPIVDKITALKYSIPMKNYVGCNRMGVVEMARLYDSKTNTVIIEPQKLYDNDERKVRGEC